jgi:hypothetical protein
LNVREEQPHIVTRFEHLESSGGVPGFNDPKTVLLKEIGCVQPQKLLVFHDEDERLRRCFDFSHDRERLTRPPGSCRIGYRVGLDYSPSFDGGL